MRKILATLSLVMLVGGALDLRAADPSVGKPAPAFAAEDIQGRKQSLADYRGKFVVLEWVNYGCPFVKKHYDSGNMQALQKELTGQGVIWLSICSSAEGKQGYMSAVEWKAAVREKGATPTAVLLDPGGKVGRLYGAKTTPHMFVIDPSGRLIYKGAIDDKPGTDPAEIQSARNYVREALKEARADKPVSVSSTASYGCSVKYK